MSEVENIVDNNVSEKTTENNVSEKTTENNIAEETFLSSSKSIFVLYLIISGNFLANLFGCRIQETLNSNMWVKHLLGFMTMYFFVVLVDSKSKLSDSPSKQMLYTMLFYSVFILTTRMDYKWWIAFIVGLSAIYILQVYKDHEKTDEKEKKKIETAQKYISYILSGVILIGFLIYFGKKKTEYSENFEYLTFLFGKTECSFNREPVKISDV